MKRVVIKNPTSNFKQGDTVLLSGGWGYYDLTTFPYGGDFHRLPSGTHKAVYIEKKSGVPNVIVVNLDGRRIAITENAVKNSTPNPSKREALFQCMECGKKFYTVASAEKAMWDGCPKCGGSDIDVAD